MEYAASIWSPCKTQKKVQRTAARWSCRRWRNTIVVEFNSSLSRIMSNRNALVLVGGDFNCGDIEWSHMQVPHGVQKRQSQQQLLDIIGEHCLTQVVNIPTRNDKTLDLLFTNAPSPVNRVKGMPPIGKADHDIVYVEYDIKAKRIKQASRKIYLYKRADMVGLKDHMAQFKDARTFLKTTVTCQLMTCGSSSKQAL